MEENKNFGEEQPLEQEACPETAESAEEMPVQEALSEEAPAETAPEVPAKATPKKIAVMAAAVVVLAAVVIALVLSLLPKAPAEAPTEPDATEGTVETVPATVPADGNPDDVTCKGSYTADAETVKAAADTVVATAGDYTLTLGQLQVFYWMEIQSFVSNYGSYASYYGLDFAQPLDTQVCSLSQEGLTWQQFFLDSALASWQNYQAMADAGWKAGFQMDQQTREYLDNLPQSLEANATASGYENSQAMLEYNMGGGAVIQDYLDFMEVYYQGFLYFNSTYEAYAPEEGELEAYFAEHQEDYAANGLTREDRAVDVRHILLMPEGGTADESGNTVYSDAEWEACRQAAQEVLDTWLAGEKTEESFGELAKAHSLDGNAAQGGIYTDVVKGQMVEPFENWCFDETRATGDSGLVQTPFGYHVMYFVDSRPLWKTTVKEDMTSEYINGILSSALEAMPLEVSYEKIQIAIAGMMEAE